MDKGELDVIAPKGSKSLAGVTFSFSKNTLLTTFKEFLHCGIVEVVVNKQTRLRRDLMSWSSIDASTYEISLVLGTPVHEGDSVVLVYSGSHKQHTLIQKGITITAKLVMSMELETELTEEDKKE